MTRPFLTKKTKICLYIAVLIMLGLMFGVRSTAEACFSSKKSQPAPSHKNVTRESLLSGGGELGGMKHIANHSKYMSNVN